MSIQSITASGVTTAASKPESKEQKQLMEACREFEAIMLQQMMKSMRATVPKSQMSQSFAMDITQDMYDEKLADEMAKSGGIGLAQVLYQQLSRQV